ncbi:acylphosphatase, partial [Salmonella enterica]|uniref:acylphosphatase n=1 Tax=Salmonella enterica TaxID=28901 RepID=UPI003D2948B4
RDGRVEALAYGPEDKVTSLINACHHGPDAALVEAVAVEDIPIPPDLVGFEQRPTA